MISSGFVFLQIDKQFGTVHKESGKHFDFIGNVYGSKKFLHHKNRYKKAVS